MFNNYKVLPLDETTGKKFFQFANVDRNSTKHFDDVALEQMIQKTEALMKFTLQCKDYTTSDTFLQSIIELTSIAQKYQFFNTDQTLFFEFVEFILSISGPTNSKIMTKNENLFYSLVDLILSLTCLDEDIFFELIGKGYLHFCLYLRDGIFLRRKDIEVYTALSRIAPQSKRIHDAIMFEFRTSYFKNIIKSASEDLLIAITKLLSSYSLYYISSSELKDILFCFAVILQLDDTEPLSLVAIGMYNIIKNCSHIKKSKNDILAVYDLMTRRTNCQSSVLIEYTLYCCTHLFLNNECIFNNYVGIPFISGCLSSENWNVQIAAAYFFSNIIKTKPDFLISNRMNVLQCLQEIHSLYQNAPYNVKYHFDELFMFLITMKSYNKDELFPLLQNGLMETLVQVLQTKDEQLFNILIVFLKNSFVRAEELGFVQEYSQMFSDLSGFYYLSEYFNNPTFAPSNPERAEVVQMILNYESHGANDAQ